jgi:DnaJ-domain-containing protein 1
MDDAFDILGLTPHFRLDRAQIERAFLAASALAHPDRAGAIDEAASARINAARAMLADPEARANCLLARLGGPSRESDRSLPNGFLMEMMELRQEIESAQSAGDAAKVEAFLDDAETRRDAHIRRVGELFDGYAASPAQSVLSELRRELNAWRYIERLIEQVAGASDPM